MHCPCGDDFARQMGDHAQPANSTATNVAVTPDRVQCLMKFIMTLRLALNPRPPALYSPWNVV